MVRYLLQREHYSVSSSSMLTYTSQYTDDMLQRCRHPVDRLTVILLQQGPILRMDGHDQATLWHRPYHHDLLVGTHEDEDQWR